MVYYHCVIVQSKISVPQIYQNYFTSCPLLEKTGCLKLFGEMVIDHLVKGPVWSGPKTRTISGGHHAPEYDIPLTYLGVNMPRNSQPPSILKIPILTSLSGESCYYNYNSYFNSALKLSKNATIKYIQYRGAFLNYSLSVFYAVIGFILI